MILANCQLVLADHAMILSDHDPAGEKAFELLLRRLEADCWSCHLEVPPAEVLRAALDRPAAVHLLCVVLWGASALT